MADCKRPGVRKFRTDPSRVTLDGPVLDEEERRAIAA
ncbi:hypothetical protein FHX61_001879 [Cupriavidus alkaliphilus]|uniref:Uncharacterized protein n=1 Tax=Cupriavidus alkaliphilus TaxID=942866 RepID=A0A7W4YRM8_9BURK|nr:hypothetical protein [Cupriavidus alkaliphilus]